MAAYSATPHQQWPLRWPARHSLYQSAKGSPSTFEKQWGIKDSYCGLVGAKGSEKTLVS